MINKALLLLVGIATTILLCVGGCGTDQDNGVPDSGVDQNDAGSDAGSEEPIETAVRIIQLDGPLAQDRSEVSGLAWYGDYLIILPQYPGFFSDGTSDAVFALHRSDILAVLDGSSGDPLEPIRIPFDDSALENIVSFQGYEAIAFLGDQVFLSIEAGSSSSMTGYLVSGTIDPALASLTVHAAPVEQIASQSGLSNMAEEAILIAGTDLISIHEANGIAVNPSPVAHTYEPLSDTTGTLAFPHIEYRITDATTLDADGRFWAINYFWPGDTMLEPNTDPLVDQFGQGETHAENDYVERLVEFQYDHSGITLIPKPPIQLVLTDESRNWEGLVRLDDRGFLLMTDKYPETILGFVPNP
ncbi:MAG: hypothetical protein JRF33_10230 [Deltaproteobacteria bacterium]|nr:hypothetical protein [Deltaproteobacteria bacterium]